MTLFVFFSANYYYAHITYLISFYNTAYTPVLLNQLSERVPIITI